MVLFMCIASPQQGGLRLSDPPSRLGAGGKARTRDRTVPADLRADSLATVPPTPQNVWTTSDIYSGSIKRNNADCSIDITSIIAVEKERMIE
ncbi:hypothetical protein PoB_000105400 [Plakobranchus ocellatus]|uniref:Uncharacterized protein n=1 Tax=Plakobranchus ocellatus TaxID=259542 RepID=A0AAV3XUJ4_9GAST|nr:hypothetical protein PoB_000105400 [Plakobranchus ocellatus]